MNLADPFIRRPVMTTLVMLGILLFGVAAYRQLPVSDLPNVDFPTLQVQASLPGASPETMASAVATPLERQFSTIAGLDSMNSTNFLGFTQITLQFNLSRDLDAAAQDVQAAIAKTLSQLPPDMPTPPTYQKVNPADQPILYLALTSPTVPLSTLDEYGQTLLAQRISTISGVAQVQVFGSQKFAVRAQVDPNQLAARGIGIDEVAQAIQAANVNLPTGTLYGSHVAHTIEASGQLYDAAAYRPVVVAWRDGSPVRLEDLGRVIDSVENNKATAWYVTHNVEQSTVVLAVQRQPGTNTVAVARAVTGVLETLRKQLPASVSLVTLYDRSVPIQESVADVKMTLLITLALVILVIFVFLRNLSATVIPSLALPMSLIGTFTVMWAAGYSLDNLSLMALTLSVGFVVDDAIVVLENIVRHMERGEPPFQAALLGSREIGFTIVSMTISLAAVFIPIIFMGGLIGRLFREFSVTIGVAILVSGFVSLTLTPMLASRFLRPPREERHGAAYRASERFFDTLLRAYDVTLTWSLRHRLTTMAVTAVMLVGTVLLFRAVPKGFLPSEDGSRIFGFTEGAQGISFESMVAHQSQLNAVIRQDPDVQAFFSTVGGRGFLAPNQGIVFMTLKDRRERDVSVDEVITRLRGKLAGVPGIRVFLQNPPPIQLGGRLTRSQYQLTLGGPSTDDLYAAAPKLEARMRQLPGLLDVTSDLQLSNPQVQVEIDRDRAASLGVTVSQIENALYSSYGSRQVSTIYAPNNQYQVILELLPEYQRGPEALPLLYVRSSSGSLVPLTAVASLDRKPGPLSVNHSGQLPSVTISFNLVTGMSLGDAVTQVERAAREVLPADVTMTFQGTAQAFQKSLQGLGLLLVLAVLVIYMVLGILYESFIHPVTILSALPFAGFGALLTLLVFGVDLSLFAFVGIILLVGLVKKNGIMMIDFAIEAERHEGRSPEDAIHQACLIRFRPITMTTMAALMGTLPIALGWGAGAESRRPLGLAVVGGLLFSQTLTLYVTPVVYLYLDALQRKLEWLPFLGRGAASDAADRDAPHPSPAGGGK